MEKTPRLSSCEPQLVIHKVTINNDQSTGEQTPYLTTSVHVNGVSDRESGGQVVGFCHLCFSV